MHIAFDLDDLLIPTTKDFDSIRAVSFPLSLIFKERFRVGAISALKQLQKDGHTFSIYTTSLRKPFYLVVPEK
jgi:hypothetical protein